MESLNDKHLKRNMNTAEETYARTQEFGIVAVPGAS